MFGRLSSYIKHHLREAESLDGFATCLEAFLKRMQRPHEKLHYVRRVDKVRDWKSFFLTMERHLRGIGGPKAPKVYEFCQLKRGLALGQAAIFSFLSLSCFVAVRNSVPSYE